MIDISNEAQQQLSVIVHIRNASINIIYLMKENKCFYDRLLVIYVWINKLSQV